MEVVDNKTKDTLLVIGSSNYDMFCYVSSFPNPGVTCFGSKFVKGFGGKGANQSVCASILGAKAKFIGCIGNDTFGKEMLDNFEKHKVNSKDILVSDTSTGIAMITVNSNSGENKVIVVPGANLKLLPSTIVKYKNEFKNAKILSCQNEINLETTLTALKLAKQVNKDLITVFNPSPFENITKECFLDVDICIVNEHELVNCLDLCLLKSSKNTKSDCDQLLKHLGVDIILVTLGEHGAYFVTKKIWELNLSTIHPE